MVEISTFLLTGGGWRVGLHSVLTFPLRHRPYSLDAPVAGFVIAILLGIFLSPTTGAVFTSRLKQALWVVGTFLGTIVYCAHRGYRGDGLTLLAWGALGVVCPWVIIALFVGVPIWTTVYGIIPAWKYFRRMLSKAR